MKQIAYQFFYCGYIEKTFSELFLTVNSILLSNILLLHYLPGYQDFAVLNVESKPETSV